MIGFQKTKNVCAVMAVEVCFSCKSCCNDLRKPPLRFTGDAVRSPDLYVRYSVLLIVH